MGEQYQRALEVACWYVDHEPVPDSPEGDRFEVLLMLIEAYENTIYPASAPDPVAAIKFRMEQAGLVAKDLVAMIGKLDRVYEIINCKRPLILAMIRRLQAGLHISAESLISGSASSGWFPAQCAVLTVHFSASARTRSYFCLASSS
ncbi:hypothetical protein GCM10022212_13750 [Actimicrobium antarcticum]|uniref:HTH-type transcriptional regulator / antitoxin HigA n=2 Tax=Actimicrobium antarcticum TaxID=1051899 RepID=A0ABP7T084_9BURK